MPNIELRLLDTPAGDMFARQTESYTRHMSSEVARFHELIGELKARGIDTEYVERYGVYMRWGIRKLEYAFVLDNLPAAGDLRILDVGSGVTILPNVLSQVGFRVDALDPAPAWLMTTTEAGQIYNTHFGSQVTYINDYVSAIRGEGVYDVITSVSVLEHLPQPEIGDTLDRIVKLLKPDGRFILTIDYCPQGQPAHGGFAFRDFKKLIYRHLSGKGDLAELRRRDKNATSYREFWASHAFPGCLYEDHRPYLSLGICRIGQGGAGIVED